MFFVVHATHGLVLLPRKSQGEFAWMSRPCRGRGTTLKASASVGAAQWARPDPHKWQPHHVQVQATGSLSSLKTESDDPPSRVVSFRRRLGAIHPSRQDALINTATQLRRAVRVPLTPFSDLNLQSRTVMPRCLPRTLDLTIPNLSLAFGCTRGAD